MISRLSHCLFALCIGLLIPSHAAQEIQFAHPSGLDALSHSEILSITEDPQGFIWFGTEIEGLFRFDGYELKRYQRDSQDQRSLSHNAILALYVDRQGTLWIGTNGGGLDRYDRNSDSFIHYQRDPKNPGSFPHDNVRVLMEDRAGIFWVGGSAGLSRFDRERGTCVTYKHDENDPNSLGDDSVRAIFEDRDTGQFWVGTRNDGLSRFDRETGRFTHYRCDRSNKSSLSDNGIKDIYKDRAGRLWVSTQKGLNQFDPVAGTFVRYEHDPKDSNALCGDIVNKTFEDRRGRFWVATTVGLDCLDRETDVFTHYRHVRGISNSISDNSCRTMFEESTGAMWISTISGGLNRVAANPEKFFGYQHDPENPASLADGPIQALFTDSRGRLWAGTPLALNCFDGVKFTRYEYDPNDPNGLTRGTVSAVTEGPPGTLWVGAGGKLHRYNGEHFSVVPPEMLNVGQTRINVICCDNQGRLWLSEQGVGLHCFDGQKGVVYRGSRSDKYGLNSRFVHCIVRDRQGILWLGTADMGFIRLDPEKAEFTTHLLDTEHPGSEAFNRVFSIFLDGDDALWLGTNQGLLRFDPATGKITHRFGQNHGLPANAILTVAGDRSGNLWLCTTSGLAKFDPRTQSVHNYDQSDGLQSNQFTWNSSAMTPDGRMYLGGPHGLSAFYPDKVQDNPHVPPVVLTEFELFDKPVVAGAEGSPLREPINVARRISINHDQSVFSLKFAALDYEQPLKNRYAYRMEGFDEDWRYTDALRRFVTYTKLDPGNYVFRVKACNNDGVWNQAGVALQIVITPPWWATWWWRGAAAISLLTVVASSYGVRVSAMKKRQRELESLVSQRTQSLSEQSMQLESANRELAAFSYSVSHDLRSPLRSIDGFSQALLEDYADRLDEAGKDYLKRVRAASQRMEHLIDDMLQLSQLTRLEMRRVRVDLSALAESIASELRTTSPQRNATFVIEPGLMVDGDPNLMRIMLENLMENAWKYTGKHSTARIEVGLLSAGKAERDGQSVYFVRDDGAGFDMQFAEKIFGAFQRLHPITEFEGTGIGLATVQRIVNRHGGRIWAEGAPERGATFYFTLPEELKS